MIGQLLQTVGRALSGSSHRRGRRRRRGGTGGLLRKLLR